MYSILPIDATYFFNITKSNFFKRFMSMMICVNQI